MEKLKLTKIDDIEGIPLYFKYIYSQNLTSFEDESKLITFREDLQSNELSAESSSKMISKTVNYKIFINEKEME